MLQNGSLGSTNIEDFVVIHPNTARWLAVSKKDIKNDRIWPFRKVGSTRLSKWPFSRAKIAHFESGVTGVVALEIHETGCVETGFILSTKPLKIKVGYPYFHFDPKCLILEVGYETFFLT